MYKWSVCYQRDIRQHITLKLKDSWVQPQWPMNWCAMVLSLHWNTFINDHTCLIHGYRCIRVNNIVQLIFNILIHLLKYGVIIWVLTIVSTSLIPFFCSISWNILPGNILRYFGWILVVVDIYVTNLPQFVSYVCCCIFIDLYQKY